MRHGTFRIAAAVTVLACAGAAAAGDVSNRIARRTYPSVFQAWNPADNMAPEPANVTLARHDLYWNAPHGLMRLAWNGSPQGLATNFTAASLTNAFHVRTNLWTMNSNLVFAAEIRYRDANTNWLGGTNHTWWLRDPTGALVYGWAEGNYVRLDFRKPDLRAQVATQARAVCEAGCDGVMLDWWDESEVFGGESMLPHRTNLLADIRAAIGPDKLILVNSNNRRTPVSAPWVNGLFMECYDTSTSQKWAQIEDTLVWAGAHLRPPRANCLEFWYHASRSDSNLMRAVTTLALTRSDGYCLFSDPNDLPTGDHLHNWYTFWDRSLGRPLGAGARQPDGSVRRDFDRGCAIFNTMGNPAVTTSFPRLMTSLATGLTSRQHVVNGADGDILLTAPFTSNDTPQATSHPLR